MVIADVFYFAQYLFCIFLYETGHFISIVKNELNSPADKLVKVILRFVCFVTNTWAEISFYALSIVLIIKKTKPFLPVNVWSCKKRNLGWLIYHHPYLLSTKWLRYFSPNWYIYFLRSKCLLFLFSKLSSDFRHSKKKRRQLSMERWIKNIS